MNPIINFISEYKSTDRERIAFAWNGKHSSEFVDANQEFRWSIAKECIENPALAMSELLEQLFLADAEWSRQAWGAPNHFAGLGRALLLRGGDSAIDAFSIGFITSFDTFGACHQICLPDEQLQELIAAVNEKLKATSDDKTRNRLESALKLFRQIQGGNATAGWHALAPGTEVTNIRIVSPSWIRRLWGRLSGR